MSACDLLVNFLVALTQISIFSQVIDIHIYFRDSKSFIFTNLYSIAHLFKLILHRGPMPPLRHICKILAQYNLLLQESANFIILNKYLSSKI